MSATVNHLRAAPGLGLIRVTGADALTFLHAQLTQRILGLAPGTGRYAAWLDPQGRVLACFDVIATADGIDLLTTAELIDPLARRLRLYVLRARVVIAVPAGVTIGALPGDVRAPLSADGIDLGDTPGSRASADGREWFRAGPTLAYVYPAPPGLPADDGTVELAEIRLGRPRIGRALSGEFTAHMLNLDTLGALAFDKGCYPGQEVVARTQNLGAAKRRLYGFRALVDGLPEPGARVDDAGGTEVGTVVRAARGDAGVELLAVVRRESITGPLRLADGGAPLERLPVPGEPAD